MIGNVEDEVVKPPPISDPCNLMSVKTRKLGESNLWSFILDAVPHKCRGLEAWSVNGKEADLTEIVQLWTHTRVASVVSEVERNRKREDL